MIDCPHAPNTGIGSSERAAPAVPCPAVFTKQYTLEAVTQQGLVFQGHTVFCTTADSSVLMMTGGRGLYLVFCYYNNTVILVLSTA